MVEWPPGMREGSSLDHELCPNHYIIITCLDLCFALGRVCTKKNIGVPEKSWIEIVIQEIANIMYLKKHHFAYKQWYISKLMFTQLNLEAV